MREILYRGQIRRKGQQVSMFTGEPQPGKWCYGGIFAPHTVKEGFAVIYGSESGDVEPVTGSKLDKFPVYRDTVGEYTGKTDKNGKRIFEGDILRITSRLFNYIVKVVYDKDECRFIGQKADGTWSEFACWESVEVIGNIYDNPELLNNNE